jgi:hypothetical protein
MRKKRPITIGAAVSAAVSIAVAGAIQQPDKCMCIHVAGILDTSKI